MVSWLDAIGFCNRLSQREYLPLYYDRQENEVTVLGGSGYRLPTEAEWEYACRAGTQTRWWCGNDERTLDQYAWFLPNDIFLPHNVGELQANPFGLFDIHGNVWEWCQDEHENEYYEEFKKQNII